MSGLIGLGTHLVRVHEADDRRDVLAAADDADDTALAQQRGHRAGEVATLVLTEQDADVVLGVLRLELVDPDEVHLGVRLRGRERVGPEQEADREHDAPG